MAATSPIKKLLTTYLRRLTNLSGNNRALFLPKLQKEQHIDLHSLSQLNKEKSFTIIEALIAQKKKIICTHIDSRLEISNEASNKLKRLQRIDNFIFEERGSHDLHVGWPFVRGKFSDDTCIRCPLLYFPVQLLVQDNQWLLVPRQESEITFNKSFLLAYSFYNNTKLSELLMEETFDSTEKDSTLFRTHLYRLLQEGKIEVNFNADNFRDELTSFINYTKPEFVDQHRSGELKLFPEAVLGIFPQASSFLLPDYQKLLADDTIIDLEELFAKRAVVHATSSDGNFINQVKEEKVYPAFTMDIWQENALKAVKLGNSVVVQGPPGTGKSHLICNLIGDAIANQKRVLVVCQKRAALDVVYNRLKEKKLTPFLVLVHDFKTDRKEVFEKITYQIEHVEDYRQKNNSLDAIQLERKFYQLSRKIDHITEELEEFKSALFDTSSCGIAIKQLYLQCSFGEPYINLKQEFSNFKFDTLDAFYSALRRYCHFAKSLLAPSYIWRNRKSFSHWQPSDLISIRDYLHEIADYSKILEQELHKAFKSPISMEAVELFADYSTEATELLSLISNESYYEQFKTVLQESEEETSSLWLSNIERLIVDCYSNGGIELTVPTSQLGDLQDALKNCMKARRDIIGLVRWELFSKDKILVMRTLLANNLTKDKQGLEQLEMHLDNRLNLEHNLSKLRDKSWLTSIPSDYSLTKFQHWFQFYYRVIHAKTIFHSIRAIKNHINPLHLSFTEFRTQIVTLFESVEKLNLRKAFWSRYLTDNQIKLFTSRPLSIEAEQTVIKDFSALIEFDKQLESLTAVELSVIEKLYACVQEWEFEKLKNVFINSLSLHWIEHIEKKHPVLTIVSSEKLNLLELELRESIQEKLIISTELILLRAREKITDDIVFNRLNNRVTYRDLLHQVTKKKKIWPLRKLVKEHTTELFQLVPCWLASPETVSAIFPMQEFFDLVIFDEASQCFTERGLPAIYRGSQILVAGDDKQLRPNDLYQARWQEDEEGLLDTEIDSVLDLAKRYVMQVDLRYHYRSQSLELIQFSNEHFYKNKLTFLPQKKASNNPTPAIEYHKIEGIWQDHCNISEAEFVVAILISHLKRNKTSVGVICFNAPQQNLIQDILELRIEEENMALPESIFIKNIENVQGDERDIIIFSIGYAPDKNGKFAMQFGSLNNVGGENRLNVAITRAREKQIIVASILPTQLQVEGITNSGPKLLQRYLTFAYSISKEKKLPVLAIDQTVVPTTKHKVMEWCKINLTSHQAIEHYLPSVDIMIMENDIYTGLILTDDHAYYESISAKDRHVLMTETADQKGWPLLKLYSRNYWMDQQKFFNETTKFITYT